LHIHLHVVVLVGGGTVQKSLRLSHFKSTEMKFGRIVLQVNVHQVEESDF